MDAVEVNVEFTNGRPASKLRMSIAVGGDTANHQFAKNAEIHWKGNMWVAALVPRFPSMILLFVSRCPVSSSCTIIISKKRIGLFRKKIATFNISLGEVDKEHVTSHGNPVISA